MISSSSTTRTDPFRELRFSGFITRAASLAKGHRFTRMNTDLNSGPCSSAKSVALITHSLEAGADACGRQGDAEGCALTRCAIDGYAPGVFLNDSIRYRQAEAGSLSDTLCRVERVVDLGNVLRCDAD